MTVRLITNVSYATVVPPGASAGVRTNVAAILIYDDTSTFLGTGPQPRIRGCGVDPAWPVFEYRPAVESALTYKTEVMAPWGVVLGEEDRSYPLGAGQRYAWGDGTRLIIELEDSNRALDIEDIEEGFPAVWPVLARKAAEYWTAPFMPGLIFGPPSQIGPAAIANASR